MSDDRPRECIRLVAEIQDRPRLTLIDIAAWRLADATERGDHPIRFLGPDGTVYALSVYRERGT